MLSLTVRAKHVKPGWELTEAMVCEAGCSGKSVHTPAVDNLNPKTRWNPYWLWDLGQDSSPLFSAFVRGRTETYLGRAESCCDNFARSLPTMR